MTRLPTGAVTFLFTDIESSTKLWAQSPDQMSPTLERHDSLMRTALASGGGHVFKTVGDAFHAAFASPSDAVSTAIATQRALRAEEWDDDVPIRVRMAVHSGEADERDGDYFGPTLNRCARLMGLGHGGQILVSRAVEELVRDHLPPDVTLRDMGEHRLRDLTHPERVFQVDAEGLASKHPALVSLDVHAHNLPRQLTSLVGREREIEDVLGLLESERLVTLTGVGGTGKTRLALQIAAEMVDDYPGGIWYVELAPVSDPSHVAKTAAGSLGLREEPGRPILDTLCDHLSRANVLLLLDNCEHLLEECARFSEHLLQATSTVRVLATSREALGVLGEVSRMVPSLSLPGRDVSEGLDGVSQEIATGTVDGALDGTSGLTLGGTSDGASNGASATIAAVRSCEATRLFVERAVSAQPQFELTPENAGAVVEVCRRLDGIPLAIELAAARVKLLRVEQVAERLDDRFRLLTGGSRTALPRQQTLQNAIDWSYDLLDEGEQKLFARLAVFVSSWTLEGAEALYSEQEAQPCEVLELMSRLADKSLVDVYGTSNPQRYRFLETVRQYAREKLSRQPDSADVRNRHLAYYLAFAEDFTARLLGPEQVESLNRLESEQTNVTAALEWGVDGTRDLESSERLTVAMWRFWHVHNHYTEAAEWARRVERMGAGSPVTERRAMVVYVAALVRLMHNDLEGARAGYEQALEMFRECGDKVGESWALNDIGLVHSHCGDREQAIQSYEMSVELKLELGDTRDAAMTLNNIGELAWRFGEYERAGEFYRRSLAVSEELGDDADPRSRAIVLHNIGELHRCTGNLADSGQLYRESLSLCCELGDTYHVACCLEGIGGLAAAERQPIRASRLLAAGEAMRAPLGVDLDDANKQEYDRMMAAARSQLDEDAWQQACVEGRTMSADEVVEYALGDD